MKEEKLEITFQNKEAKELFITILEEYDGSITTLMAELSISKKYGATEPFINITGEDTAYVGVVQDDKGIVIGAQGFANYKDIPVGEKYAQVASIKGQNGLVVFVKSGEGRADNPLGFAPSVKEVFEEVNKEDLNVEEIKPVNTK